MVLKTKRIVVGILGILLGVVGVIVPVIPGWPFFLFSVFLLSRDIPPVRPLRTWLDERYPKLRAPIERWEIRLGLHDKKV